MKKASIKETENNCWQGCGKIGTFVQCWWECKMVQLLWKIVLWFLKKVNIELPYRPKELKARTQRDIYTPIFIAELFPIAKRWKQAVSIHR